MGLTIHWTLSTQQGLSDAVVKELAARTKAFAQKIDCEKVLGPKRGGPEEIKLRQLPVGVPLGGASVLASRLVSSLTPPKVAECTSTKLPNGDTTGDFIPAESGSRREFHELTRIQIPIRDN